MNAAQDDAHCVEELRPESTGIWRITTAGSTHVLDLDAGTATRFPGPAASPTINDCERPLRTLDACSVGKRGRWTMHTDGWSDSIDYYWQVTSVIARIEEVKPSERELSAAASS